MRQYRGTSDGNEYFDPNVHNELLQTVLYDVKQVEKEDKDFPYPMKATLLMMKI